MRLHALTGHGDRGPACFLLETGPRGPRFLLDLGEGPDAGRRPDLTGVGRVDAILISHGHPDHVGALDLAGAVGDPPIHATAAVRALSADARLAEARALPFSGTIEIAGIAVETGPAGHAPGGVWMRIGGPSGLLYTGDFSPESTLYPFAMPPPARLAVVDAAYGADDTPLAERVDDLVRRARERPLLLPVPAAGRGLEMAMVFAEAGIEVGLCPAHLKVAHTLLTSGADALAPGGRTRLAATLARARRLDERSAPTGVMIAAKPNAEGGLAAVLAHRFAAGGGAEIIFTGHVAEGHPSQRLIATGRASFLRWNVHPRLGDLAALVGAMRPEAVLPAFLEAGRMADLAARLPCRVVAAGEDLS